MSYYQGLAWRRLGQEPRALEAMSGLIRFARESLGKAPAMDYFAKFGEKESAQRRQAQLHYLAGLGLLGRGERKEAESEFKKALALQPYFFRAQRRLASGDLTD
jgi:tetratricopeptide (TPR) repeat protein